MDQMASRLNVWPQVSFIKLGTYKGIGKRLIEFCVYVSVVVGQFAPVTLLFICGKHFEFVQASSDSIGQNLETTITSFKIAR